MRQFHFKKLLQIDSWKSDVLVSVDEHGAIISIDENAERPDTQVIDGFALPGFQNAHSHAFQYAMAGIAEVHDTKHTSDNFWTWREAMYKLALSVSPEQMEAIATMLYREMLRHGYTNVAEFHYVHHDKNGNRYDNLSEMGERLISAAKTAGINITLVPIFYQKGGFGEKPSAHQRRFISTSMDDYLKLLDSSEKSCAHYDGANIAMGIHSMRAVEARLIAEIAQSGPQNLPFHIHVAEQVKEIEDSIAYLGKRPVEWLIDNVELNERFHLVHATHLSKVEVKGIAESQANVVLCPSTEGNLGDGLFPLQDFQNYGGNWSIGTDSHIGINPLEEIRLLDYGQRLNSHDRGTFAKKKGDSGAFAIEMTTAAGRKAMNNSSKEYFKVGDVLNAVVFDAASPLLSTTSEGKLSSSLIYTSDASHYLGTISRGKMFQTKKMAENNASIRENFKLAISELKNR